MRGTSGLANDVNTTHSVATHHTQSKPTAYHPHSTSSQADWLSWAEKQAKDSTIKQALNSQHLRPLLRPILDRPKSKQTTHAQKLRKAKQANLVSRFLSQITDGCTLAVCTAAYCRTNPRFATSSCSKAGVGVLGAQLLAIELAQRALANPNIAAYQPHTESVLGKVSSSKDMLGLELESAKGVDAKGQAGNSTASPQCSFAASMMAKMQQLLFSGSSSADDSRPTHTLPDGTKSTTQPQSIPACTKPEKLSAVTATKRVGTPLVVSAATKTVIGLPTLTNSNNRPCPQPGQRVRTLSLSSSDAVSETASAGESADGKGSVEDAISGWDMSCDDSGDPLLAVTRLNAAAVDAVVAIGGKLLSSTLRTVLASPGLLAECFREPRTDHEPQQGATALGMDMQAVVQFAERVFGDQKAKSYGHVAGMYRAVSHCVLVVERRLRRDQVLATQTPGLGESPPVDLLLFRQHLQPLSRALAAIVVILGSDQIDHASHVDCTARGAPYPHELRNLRVRVARLVVRVVFEFSQRTPASVECTGMEASGWYAGFARTHTAVYREWNKWWAIAPARMVRVWVRALQSDAQDAIRRLCDGVTSERVVAQLLVTDPVPWVGALELLRVMFRANEELASRMLAFDARVALGGDYGSVDRELFADDSIVQLFDLRSETVRWVRAMARDEYGEEQWVDKNRFSILYYPFLLSSEQRAQLHVYESHERMRRRYLSAHDRQAEVVQNQRILHVDTHAEQIVRMGVRPAWPLLASNRTGVALASSVYFVLAVRRSHVVQDTMDMMRTNMFRVRYPFKVRFVAGGEDGVDMGGVQKEFFSLLMPKLLSPEAGLFVFADGESRGYMWPDGASPHSLEDFEIVGALLGIAFVNGIPLGSAVAPLAPLLVRMLAFGADRHEGFGRGRAADEILDEVADTFPRLVDGLRQLLEWDEEVMGLVSDVFCAAFEATVSDPLCVWASRTKLAQASSVSLDTMHEDRYPPPFDRVLVAQHASGDAVTFPLIRDGSQTEVTSANRADYVRRYVEFVSVDYVHAQVAALRRGFVKAADGIAYRLMPASELQRMLSGGEDAPISAEALERIAGYDDEYGPGHEVVRMFWRVVGGFTQPQLKKLLAFVTSSDKVPLGGYASITFVVQRNGPDSDRLPTALTCFGRLLLPAYASEARLRERLVVAIENCEGFGLV